jgi:hypothetical protein
MGPAARTGGFIALVAALLAVGVLASSLALPPRTGSRALGGRFVRALDGESDDRPEAFLSADAQVFLQGAAVGMSRGHFQQYLDGLRRRRQVFHAASPVYVTASGAGWLLDIKYAPEVQIVNPPGSELPPQLWMEARIADESITRLWIHFTVEALVRQQIQLDDYRAQADIRGTPVPEAWQDGTVAMLAVAQRPRRHERPTRACQGQLLANLRELHLRARAVGPGGSGESSSLAQWSGCATRSTDLEYNRTRGVGAHTPAGVDDHGARAAPRAEAEANELVAQA